MIEIKSILEVENFLEKIEAVIFDLDDTLFSEKEYVRSGYKAISKHFKDPSLEYELWNAFEHDLKAIDVVFQKKHLLDRKDEALHIYRFHYPNIHLYSGVAEMLERIHTKHKIGIITDGRPEGQKAKISALGLCMDKLIITDELGGIDFRKPNKKAFVMMHDELNVPFEKMVYVGDNINKDFVAPSLLNMKCIYFNNKDGIYHK